jgi:pilus assembly protein Flp/PilA
MVIIDNIRTILSRISGDDTGVTAVEYGLFAALIAAVIVGVVTTIGTDLSGMFTTLASSL